MRLALRTAFATLALCFAGCATTASQSVALQTAHGPTMVRQQPSIAMSASGRTTSTSVEPSTGYERSMAARGDRGIPMPEPARDAMHALPTPQVPIPYEPTMRTMPAYTGGRGGGNAAYWQ